MNPIKIFIRYISKNLLHFTLNLAGLTLGFTSVMLISVWLKNEWSYDRHVPHHEHTYRLTVEVQNSDGYHAHFARCWQKWTRQFQDFFPEIERMALFVPLRKTAVKIGDIKFNSDMVFRCNQDALDVFDIQLLSGNRNTVLSRPNTILISESTYQKYHNSPSPADTIAEMAGAFDVEFIDYQVAGIFKDFPPNAHLHPEILVSLEDVNGFNGWAYTYFTLLPGKFPEDIVRKYPEFAKIYLDEESQRTNTIHLQKIADIHLFSKKDWEIEKNGDINAVIALLSIALVILFLTLVNFLNLNMVLMIKRKNVYILKRILGSGLRDVLTENTFETVLQIMLAALISLGSVLLILTLSNPFNLPTIIFSHLGFLITFSILLVLLTSTICLVPHFILIINTVYRQVPVLQTDASLSAMLHSHRIGIGRFFVIFQFTLSVILISSAFYIDRQEKYLWNKRMAFDSESVVVIKDLNWKMREKYPELKRRLLQIRSVKGVTSSMEPPAGFLMDAVDLEMDGLAKDEDLSIYVFPVEDNYIDFYDIPVIAGRSFNPTSLEAKKEEYILNQTALGFFGFNSPEEALGRQFKPNFYIDSLFQGGTIVGVIEDFFLSPLFEGIKPLVLFEKPIWYSTVLIKIDTVHKMNGLTSIEEIWNEIYPDYVFDYSFDDDLYQQAYQNENLQSRLGKYLTLLALVIAFMGLFGVSAIIIRLRIKEICIRKVNGASSWDVLVLLSRNFIRWIFISLLIATPSGWAILNAWSQNYPYRVAISWWIFPMAGILAFIIAWLSISYFTLKAAFQNPAIVLRYE